MHRISSKTLSFTEHSQRGPFLGNYLHGPFLIVLPIIPKGAAFGGDDISSAGVEGGRRHNVAQVVPLVLHPHGDDSGHEH